MDREVRQSTFMMRARAARNLEKFHGRLRRLRSVVVWGSQSEGCHYERGVDSTSLTIFADSNNDLQLHCLL